MYFLENLENYIGDIGGHHSDNTSTTEDGNHGIALHIFENIGIEYGYVLDIGAFSYNGSNVTPIMDKYNIPGLLLDGANKYNDKRITKVWLEPTNVVDILQKNDCPKNLDYLSIDIDNMDYWVLKSILEGGYTTNLLIAEFNPIWSYDEAYTKQYKESASKKDGDTKSSSNYGVSLYGLVKLLSPYGYRLIHVVKQNEWGQPTSNNAFFIHDRFDGKDKFKNQSEVIQTLLPTPFIEHFKEKGNISKFRTNDLDVVKSKLKSTFLEL